MTRSVAELRADVAMTIIGTIPPEAPISEVRALITAVDAAISRYFESYESLGERKAPVPKQACPDCGKLVGPQGMATHRGAHLKERQQFDVDA